MWSSTQVWLTNNLSPNVPLGNIVLVKKIFFEVNFLSLVKNNKKIAKKNDYFVML